MKKEALEKMRKIAYAKKFCDTLLELNVDYQWCIKHPEVLGCEMSKQYYKRYETYIGHDYSICKNLLLQERKGEHRILLIIVDDTKNIDLKELQKRFHTTKLEFLKQDLMKELLQTVPGNVSVFHVLFDKKNQIEVYIDEELLQEKLLAFHPLYNGMSMFIKPKEIIKFLNMLKRNRIMTELPEKEPLCLKK